MKQTKVFVLCLMAFLSFNSCQKELVPTPKNEQWVNLSESILERAYSKEECGRIPGLCLPCKIEAWPDNVVARIKVNNGDEQFEVMPLSFYDGSDEFLIRSEQGDFILSNSNNEFIRSRKLETLPFPNKIYQLFNLNFEDLTGGHMPESSVKNILGDESYIDEEGLIHTDLATFPYVDDGGGSEFILDFCEGVYTRTLEKYYEVLNQPEPVSSSMSTWMSLVDPAFSTCSDGLDLETECVDTRCVIDQLMDSPGLTDDQRGFLAANYLNGLLDLSPEEYNFLRIGSGREFARELLDKMGEDQNLGHCEDEDCSLSSATQSVIELASAGIPSSTNYSEQFDFYARLHCCGEELLTDEVEDVKLLGYPDNISDDRLESMLNMCCGAEPMTQEQVADLIAEQIESELASIGESWPTSEAAFTDDFWEIMYEMMKEVLPELIPGVDTYLELKRSMESYNNGEYWESAQHFSLAMLTVAPADECADFIKVFKVGKKGFKIFRLFSRLKDLNPAMAKGFKETLL